MLGLDRQLFELVQRPQPHVQDRVGLYFGELEGGHQPGFRIVRRPNDADDFVEVQERDQKTVEHFQAVRNLPEAVVRAADQHDLPVLQPLLQHLTQTQNVRHDAARQHVHVEGKAQLKLGQLEHLLHQHNRIDGAALRLQHEADVLGGFIAHVVQQRQALCCQKFSDLLDEL